jgi:hypothetical protein
MHIQDPMALHPDVSLTNRYLLLLNTESVSNVSAGPNYWRCPADGPSANAILTVPSVSCFLADNVWYCGSNSIRVAGTFYL